MKIPKFLHPSNESLIFMVYINIHRRLKKKHLNTKTFHFFPRVYLINSFITRSTNRFTFLFSFFSQTFQNLWQPVTNGNRIVIAMLRVNGFSLFYLTAMKSAVYIIVIQSFWSCLFKLKWTNRKKRKNIFTL